MTARTPKRTVIHLSSHDEDVDDEGGRDGYPSDHQTAPKKYFVGLSGNRDQAAKLLDSEASETVDDRTVRKRVDAETEYDRLRTRVIHFSNRIRKVYPS